jgi:hypothetical protein
MGAAQAAGAGAGAGTDRTGGRRVGGRHGRDGRPVVREAERVVLHELRGHRPYYILLGIILCYRVRYKIVMYCVVWCVSTGHILNPPSPPP